MGTHVHGKGGSRDESDERAKTDLKIKRPPQSSDHSPRDIPSPKGPGGVIKILKTESAFAKPSGSSPRNAGKRLAFADQVGGNLCENVFVEKLHYSTESVTGADVHKSCCTIS